MKKISRRQALKNLAVITGGSLAATTVAGVMAGCRAETDSSYSPETLNMNQFALVGHISDLIIPETDTPGAKAAGVDNFIDKMLTDWNTDDEVKQFLNGIEEFQMVAVERYDNPFPQMTPEQQIELLDEIDSSLFEARELAENKKLMQFFNMMKEFTVIGYYTSEIGASRELNLNLVPGYYDACVPYSEIGKAWSG